MSLIIESTDYIPMDSFPRKFRFVDEKYHKLSVADLARVKPLKKEKSKEINEKLSKFILDYQLSTERFSEIISIGEVHENSDTVNWLKQKETSFENEIIVSWDDDNCVLTDFKFFCSNWDDFCYPGSDDVIIISRNEKACLFYCHEDIFEFGVFK
ncbi:MAG: hypothetical protein H6754_02125 [Candidatus Omnitrophica bacterium]|nr:hypothetical protein [Candidatus Omnitrophota bacterium]